MSQVVSTPTVQSTPTEYDKTDICNHYVMPSVELKRSHGEIYVYVELYKQKRRADDELEFSRVPYSDPKQ